MKVFTGIVVGLILAFTGMFAANPSYFQQTRSPSPMVDGTYTVYHIQKMFNPKTGEPVYWVIGGKGRMATLGGQEVYIEPAEVTLFTIPQNHLVGVTAEDIPGYQEKSKSLLIKMTGPVGMVIPR